LKAHPAYTWDELAEAIRKAYIDITQVYVLPKFINWSASIEPYLNDASKTVLPFTILWFQNFSDFRCFHFCKKEILLRGVTKCVGIMECKPDAASQQWGDTKLTPGNFVLLIKDPHQLLDYDNWWKKSLGNIKPHAIPPLSPDVIQKLQHQLNNSADRIWRTRKPSKKQNKMREYTPEEVAMIDRISRDNAIKRAMQLEACKIFPSLDSVETSLFVIVRCLKSDADPFMVAEVISNNYETNRLVVQWWAPTPLSWPYDFFCRNGQNKDH